MFNWYKKVVFENYANFNGRARRSEFWYFMLLNMILTVTLMLIDKALGLKIGIQSVYGLLVFLPGLAVTVRRLHDIGKSGWWMLVFYLVFIVAIMAMTITFMGLKSQNSSIGGYAVIGIPLVIMFAGGIWLLVLHCKAGNTGANKYGSDPKLHGQEINEIGTA